MKKKILTIITTVVMAAAFMPTFAFANDAQTTAVSNDTFHYVALGDASTNGYGMAEKTGYRIDTEGTYPDLIRDKVEASGYDVDLHQMGISGMRVEELRCMLEDGYDGDSYTRDKFKINLPAGKSYATLKAEFKSGIKDADLITVNLGANNVGAYVLYRAGGEASGFDASMDDPAVQALAQADAKGIKASIMGVTTNGGHDVQWVLDKIGGAMPAEFDLNEYVDSIVYTYYSFTYNYDKAIADIKALNPNADIIAIGIRNMLGDNLTLTVNALGINDGVNIGKLYKEQLVDKVNAHIKGVAGLTKYVDISGTQRFLEEIQGYQSCNTTSALANQQLSDQMILLMDSIQHDMYLQKEVKNLAAYKKAPTANKNNALKAAYDVVATAIKNGANKNEAVIDIGMASQLINKEVEISTLGDDLMADLKANSASVDKNGKLVEAGAANKVLKGTAYTGADTFINSAYSTNNAWKKIAMAIGVRTKMGDGFFQQPSAKGHQQIVAAILATGYDRIIHHEAKDSTATEPGNIEYWECVIAGKCYKDAGLTQEVSKADCLIKGGQDLSHDPIKVAVKKTATFDVKAYGELSCKADSTAIATVTLKKTGDGYTVSVKGKKAGTTYITLTAAGDAVHYSAEAKVKVIVPTKLSKVALSSASSMYDGTAKVPQIKTVNKVTTLVEGTDYTVKYTDAKGVEVPEIKNVGTYYVQVVAKDGGCCEGSAKAKYTIKKAKQAITNVDATYACPVGNVIQLEPQAPGTGKITFKSSSKKVATVDAAGQVTAVKAGKAKITITIAADGNYDKATKTVTVKVLK